MQVKSVLWAIGIGAAAAVTAEMLMPKQMQQARCVAAKAMETVEDGVSRAADALR